MLGDSPQGGGPCVSRDWCTEWTMGEAQEASSPGPSWDITHARGGSDPEAASGYCVCCRLIFRFTEAGSTLGNGSHLPRFQGGALRWSGALATLCVCPASEPQVLLVCYLCFSRGEGGQGHFFLRFCLASGRGTSPPFPFPGPGELTEGLTFSCPILSTAGPALCDCCATVAGTPGARAGPPLPPLAPQEQCPLEPPESGEQGSLGHI